MSGNCASSSRGVGMEYEMGEDGWYRSTSRPSFNLTGITYHPVRVTGSGANIPQFWLMWKNCAICLVSSSTRSVHCTEWKFPSKVSKTKNIANEFMTGETISDRFPECRLLLNRESVARCGS